MVLLSYDFSLSSSHNVASLPGERQTVTSIVLALLYLRSIKTLSLLYGYYIMTVFQPTKHAYVKITQKRSVI